jgi:tetratricopeptide (TPR) repeat protein
VLRVVYILQLRSSPLSSFPVLDELYHVEWARNLAAGHWLGSEVFFRAPLYPYTLGLIFAAFHGSLLAARFVQAIYGSLIPVVVFFLGRRVFGRRAAIAGGAAAALYPLLIYYTHELLIVTLVVLLDLLLVITALRAERRRGGPAWLLVGVVAGMSAIARPSVLIFVPVLVWWMWWRAANAEGRGVRVRSAALRRVAPSVGMLIVGIAIFVLPVTARNYAVGRDFVLISSQGGINFFIGNNAASDGASAVLPVLGESWENEDAERIAEAHAGRPLKPSEVSDFWYKQGLDFVFGQPIKAAKLGVRKLTLFWDSYELANNKDIYYFGRMSGVFRSFSWLNFGLIAPFALLGMYVSVRRNPAALLMVLFVVSYMIGVVLFFVNARFRLPIVPFLILFAVVGAGWLIEQIARRRVRPLLAAVPALVVLFFFVNHDFYSTHAGDRAQTHMTLGRVAAAEGKQEKALSEYRRAIEISPNYAKAYNSMGLALEKLGRDDEAIRAFEEAAAIDSTLATARNNAGSYYLRHGDVERARTWFEKAIAIDPGLAEARLNLAAILADEGKLNDAAHQLQSAVAAEPDFKEGWDALGRLLQRVGDLSRATSAFARAVSIDPGYVDARHDLGVALAMQGRYSEALSQLSAARALSPDDPGIAADYERVRQLLRSAGG